MIKTHSYDFSTAQPAIPRPSYHFVATWERLDRRGVMIYTGLYLLTLSLFCMIGKDLLNNPIRTGIMEDPYGNYYQALRYAEFVLVVIVSAMGRAGLPKRALMMGAHFWPYIFIAALSFCWSADPWITGRYAVLMMCYTYTIGYITIKLGPIRIVAAIMHFVAFVLIASTFLALFMPEIGRHSASDATALAHLGKWRGIFSYKNALGPFSALGCVLSFTHGHLMTRSRIYLWAMRLCAVACLIFAKSSSAFGGIAVMVFFYILLKPKRLMSFGMMSSVVIAFCLFFIVTPSLIAEALGRDSSFTGRTEIWAAVLDVWRDNPIFGYGYMAGSIVLQPRLMGGVFESAVDAHNAYLDLMIDLGLLGLVTFLYAIARSFKLSYDAVVGSVGSERDANVAMAMILSAGCILAVTEVAPLHLVGYGGPIFLATAISMGCHSVAARRRSLVPAQTPVRLPRPSMNGDVRLS